MVVELLAAIDPIDKFFESHFVSEMYSFRALIEGNGAVPGVTNKSELEVGLELFSSDLHSPLFRQGEIQDFQNTVLSPPVVRPVVFHLVFDLPQVEMRFPRFTENGPNAGRAGLGYLYENAFILMTNHISPLVVLNIESLLARVHTTENGSAGTRTRNQRLKRALLYRLSYRPTWNKACKPDQTLLQEFAGAILGCAVTADRSR